MRRRFKLLNHVIFSDNMFYRFTAFIIFLLLLSALQYLSGPNMLHILSKNVAVNHQQTAPDTSEQARYQMQIDTLAQRLSLEMQCSNSLRSQLTQQRASVVNPCDYFDKICYLTFDDGPSPLTEQILSVLSENHIRATFFVNYTFYGDKNNLYQRILDEGHALGNHTYSHVYPHSDQFYQDFQALQLFLEDEVHYQPEIIRIPGGTESNWAFDSMAAQNIDRLVREGYVFFDWTTLSGDSQRKKLPPERLVENVISYSNNRPIEVVLMHDRNDNKETLQALKGIIDYYRAEGYVFMPLDTAVAPAQFYQPLFDKH